VGCRPARRPLPAHWPARAQLVGVNNGSCSQHPGRTRPECAGLATLRLMALDTAPRTRRDRGAGDRPVRGVGEVPGDRGTLTRGRPADVVTPRSLGRARSTLRATLRVAPAAPPSRTAYGGLRSLIPRPVRQLSVGASRVASSRPDQDPSALRALRCGSSLGPVVPRRRSRPLSRALCRTGRGNGWQNTRSIVPPVPVSAPYPEGPDGHHQRHNQQRDGEHGQSPGQHQRGQVGSSSARRSGRRRAVRTAALHDQIGEQVAQLIADPQWRAMLDAAMKASTPTARATSC
jgi:hypothetical protein